MLDYSVIIRTTGKAGAKYQGLLDSIAGLEPQPREVIVVLPDGLAGRPSASALRAWSSSGSTALPSAKPNTH